MERVCFTMQVRPHLIEEYRAVHAAVWPHMLQAIEAAGRRNYSLFLREDGLLVGYYEVNDRRASERALAADPRTMEWEERARHFFEGHEGRPDQGTQPLLEVFNLADQLASLGHRS